MSAPGVVAPLLGFFSNVTVRTPLVVTPMQAVSAGPRRASRSILPLTASSCLTHRLTADAVETRGCRADQNQRSVLRSGAVHAAGARRIGDRKGKYESRNRYPHGAGWGARARPDQQEPETSELSWRIRPCKKVRGPAWLNGENRLTFPSSTGPADESCGRRGARYCQCPHPNHTAGDQDPFGEPLVGAGQR